MIDWASVVTYFSGTYPDVLAINSSGAATQDGTEWIAELINNGIFGPSQAILDYANLTPDGVTEAAGASQIIEAIQKGNAVGPGMYVQRAINDTPAVYGDRVLILAEQGVLIASYPELDAATYVGDANNTTVASAGGKFYRSSDAGGSTPNIAGPYLQLPAQPEPKFLKQYLGDGTDFTVTGGAGFSLIDAKAIPYKTLDGAWRLIFTISYNQSSSSIADINASGVTSKNSTGFFQAFTATSDTVTTCTASRIAANGNAFVSRFTAAVTAAYISGDIELDSKPTWAEDFDIEWGITH